MHKPSNIKVAVRIRPVLPDEEEKGLQHSLERLKVENNTLM